MVGCRVWQREAGAKAANPEGSNAMRRLLVGVAVMAFVLAGVNARVREVLDLTRLSSILPLTADVDAGLEFLKGRRAGAS